MIEHLLLLRFILYILIIIYVLSQVRLVLLTRRDNNEHFISNRLHKEEDIKFLVPCIEKELKLSEYHTLFLNREIIYLENAPKITLSMYVHYNIMDEVIHNQQDVKQQMKHLIHKTTTKYVETFGSVQIQEQKIALKSRIKGAIHEKTLEWGVEIYEIEIILITDTIS